MVRFLFAPDDFESPGLLANLDVYYHNCTQRGLLIGSEIHNCTRGLNWLDIPCVSCWKFLGKCWMECQVVSANSRPLEKWQRIKRYKVFNYGKESSHWELVWKSPFSNSLCKMGPFPPKGGWVEWVDTKYDQEYGICCKMGDGFFLLPVWADHAIRQYFESE